MADKKLKIWEALELNEKTAKRVNVCKWDFARMFAGEFSNKGFDVFGEQVTFGGDYVTLEEARHGIEWLVDQLGGSVKWKR